MTTPPIRVALLRGINVGGRNKVEMSRLRTTLESAGLAQVRTYINSGNVLFRDGRQDATLTPLVEKAIESEFGFPVKVLLRDVNAMTSTEKAIPASWKDDATTRCYVLFLWKDVDEAGVVDGLAIKKGIDRVKYVPGAIIWRVDRADLTRSGMMRVTSTDLYQSVTIRNCNTVRKLTQLMTRDQGQLVD